MSNRRRFGALRLLPSGRWQARYVTSDGRQHTAPSTFATKTDADRFLATVDTDLGRGTWIDPHAGRATFAEYTERWLTERPLRPRTRELYRQLLDSYLLPAFGATPLSKITPAAVRSWHADLVRGKGQDSTVPAKAYRLLRAVMATADADEIVPRNPCNIPKAGAERAPERPTVTVPQVHALAAAVPARYRVLVLLAAFSGLRWGELAALRRGRVDLGKGTVTVTEALCETIDGKLTVGPPKSDAGRRTVALPAFVVAELDAHLAAYVGPDADALLFTREDGAPLRRRGYWYDTWRGAKRTAGVDPGVHFHDLRHLAGTLTAATGATMKELMARLGHSSTRAALIYQHATEDRDAAIAAALDRLVTSAADDRPRATVAALAGRRSGT